MFNLNMSLTPADVAERENLSTMYVWYLLRERKLIPSRKVGTTWLIADPYIIIARPRGRPKKQAEEE